MANLNKTVLITGANKGIGAALALSYAKEHAQLILIARDETQLAKVASDCLKAGAQGVSTVKLDLTQFEHVRSTLQQLDLEHQVDLVIANAGTTNSLGKLGEPEQWHDTLRVLNTNLTGLVATIEPLILGMRERKKGQIALISSLAAFRGMPITPAYSASKAGVKAYGEALRGWLRHSNIQVSVIYPGFVKSAMSDRFEGQKPWMLSPEKAAHIITRGLDKNHAHITFPFLLSLGTRALALAPSWLADPIMDALSYGAKR